MEKERTEANGREVQAIMHMALLDGYLPKDATALEARLRTIPNGWRNFRLMTSLAGKLLSEIYDTMTSKQLLSLQRTIQNSEVVIRPRQITRTTQYMTITDTDAEQLINTAMANECAICFKQGPDIKKCSLRRTMMNVAPPDDLPANSCAYRDVALSVPVPGVYIGVDLAAEDTTEYTGGTQGVK